MAHLLILRGPPASGKSTYRKDLMTTGGWRYVNGDEERKQFPELAENDIQQRMTTFARVALGNGLNVIVDNTNLSPKTVQRWVTLAQEMGATHAIKTFAAPLDELIRRDAAREQSVRRSVIYKMCVNAGFLPVPAIDERIPAIVFDIDGTIADLSHRLHHVKQTPKDWASFYAALHLDTVHRPVQQVYDALVGVGHIVLFVSGRGEEQRGATEAWLDANGFSQYVYLIMRGFRDRRPDDEVKHELYQKYIEPFYAVQMVFDDRPRVIRMWRSLGLKVFDVGDGVEF